MTLIRKTRDRASSCPCASTGCVGGQQRRARPVAHSGVNGSAEFGGEDVTGTDGTIERAATTIVGLRFDRLSCLAETYHHLFKFI